MYEAFLKSVKSILDQIVQENGFCDYTIHIRPGSEPGDGFNSDLLSITITDNASDKKLQIVCKTCKDPNLYIFFYREVLFYSKLMPILAKFQEERLFSKIDQFLSYPKCYATVANDDQELFVVIMEDIRLQGFKMRNRAEVTPIENIRLVMRELGKLHGLSIAMKDQQPDQFAIIKQTTDINYSLYVSYCINSETSDKFLVLSHGDLWNNNILYRYNEHDTVIDAQFLDWQLARYGSLALDLLYIIFSATDRALRDKEYENLLNTYYESLSKSVAILGTNPNKLFSFTELKHEMKRCGNFVLAMMPILIYGSTAHQMIGQDSKGVLNVKDQLEYERRLNEIFEDIVSMGSYLNIN